MNDTQYIESVQKGTTVMHGNKPYRVQDDGKGYLHIIVFEEGKRKKISINKLLFFDYGTGADYVFNGWWKLYHDFNQFKQFADAEKAWADQNKAE